MTKISDARRQVVEKPPNFREQAIEVLSDIDCMDTSHLSTEDTDLIDRAATGIFVSENAFNGLKRILSRLERKARGERGGW